MKGIVVSLKNKKTAVVRVARDLRHPRLSKIIKRHKNFACLMVGQQKLSLGQRVEIKETSPRSARKSWLIAQVYD